MTPPSTVLDHEGEALICDGCGTTRTVAAIRAASPRAFSCCPERRMLPARHFWRLALELQRKQADELALELRRKAAND